MAPQPVTASAGQRPRPRHAPAGRDAGAQARPLQGAQGKGQGRWGAAVTLQARPLLTHALT